MKIGTKKLLQGLVSHELTVYVSIFNLFLTQWIMVILSEGCKPDNFEPHNSLKLSFRNIWCLHSNFAEYKYFLESNSPDILALCETNLDDSIDSGRTSKNALQCAYSATFCLCMSSLLSKSNWKYEKENTNYIK